MGKHDHTKPQACKHKFNHCGDCDVVFCLNCNKEWGQKYGTISNGGTGSGGGWYIPAANFNCGAQGSHKPVIKA